MISCHIKKILIPACFLFFQIKPVLCQIRPVGKVISYKKVRGGIEGSTKTGIFDVRAYSDHIIRVRVSQQKTFSNFSYA